MTLVIDTGTAETPVRQMMPDYFLDWHPDADDLELTKRYCLHIMGEIRRPKRMETVRKTMLVNWSFLRIALEACPGHVDEVFTEYVERLQGLD